MLVIPSYISHTEFYGLRKRLLHSFGVVFGRYYRMLDELDFRQALDEYCHAEFRLGK